MDAYTAPLPEVRAKALELGMLFAADWPEVSLRRAVATRLRKGARRPAA